MNRELPPIAKLAMRVLACVEEAVTRFPRKHRYTLGSDLRSRAMAVARATHMAWRDHLREIERVRKEHAECIDYYEAKLVECERRLDEDSAEIDRLRGGLELIAKDTHRLMNEVARQTAASILAGKPIGTADQPTVVTTSAGTENTGTGCSQLSPVPSPGSSGCVSTASQIDVPAEPRCGNCDEAHFTMIVTEPCLTWRRKALITPRKLCRKRK